jgi:two-component system sensor histidine kinase HydH
MNFYALPAGIAALYSIIMATLVIARNRTSPVNRAFSLLLIVTFIWQAGNFFALISSAPLSAQYAIKCGFAGIALIPVVTYYLMISFLQISAAKTLYGGLFVGVGLAALVWVSPIYSGVYNYSWGYWYRAGILYPLYGVYFVYYSYRTFSQLIAGLAKETKPAEKNRQKYLMFGLLIAYFGSIDFLPTYGINIFPFSFIFLIASFTIFFYAIVRYRLMHVSLVIRKTLVYSSVVSLLTGLFVVAIISLTHVISSLSEQQSFMVSTFIALVIALLFNPLKNKVQAVVDKYFYKTHYDYYHAIQHFTRELAIRIEREDIYKYVVNSLFDVLKVKGVSLYIRKKDNYEEAFSKNVEGSNGVVAGPSKLTPQSPMIRLLEDAKEIVFKRNDARAQALDYVSTDFAESGFEMAVPVIIGDSLECIIFLKAKRSEDLFSDEDISLLRTIAGSIAMSIKVARIHEEKIKSEKMATIGLVAATLAHEIKNPLASIKTFCELLPKKYNADQEFRESFTHIVPSEICRIDKLVSELLELSRQRQAETKTDAIEIPALLTETLKLFSAQHEENGIQVLTSFNDNHCVVKGNKDKLKQAIINLIANCTQAMPMGGILKVSTAVADGRLVIHIQDTGPGIEEKDLKHLFVPFYSTKETGIGLGLPISKGIIEDHGGTIDVISTPRLGATYMLTFDIPDMVMK